jgi:hypothetical protein
MGSAFRYLDLEDPQSSNRPNNIAESISSTVETPFQPNDIRKVHNMDLSQNLRQHMERRRAQLILHLRCSERSESYTADSFDRKMLPR